MQRNSRKGGGGQLRVILIVGAQLGRGPGAATGMWVAGPAALNGVSKHAWRLPNSGPDAWAARQVHRAFCMAAHGKPALNVSTHPPLLEAPSAPAWLGLGRPSSRPRLPFSAAGNARRPGTSLRPKVFQVHSQQERHNGSHGSPGACGFSPSTARFRARRLRHHHQAAPPSTAGRCGKVRSGTAYYCIH